MSYAETTLREHRRLAILRHLEAIPEYSGNASILQDVLNGLKITSTRSQVLTDLAWLEEQGFVKLREHDDLVLVTATQAGVEIARGLARHPQIRRPGPLD
jgi:hypothetical protein